MVAGELRLARDLGTIHLVTKRSRLGASAWATLLGKQKRGREDSGFAVFTCGHVRCDTFQQEFSDEVGCSVGAGAG